MGILGAVVQRPVLSVFQTGQDLARGRPIAFQLIHDGHPRPRGNPFNSLPKDRHLLGPSARHQDIEDLAVLVDGAP